MYPKYSTERQRLQTQKRTLFLQLCNHVDDVLAINMKIVQNSRNMVVTCSTDNSTSSVPMFFASSPVLTVDSCVLHKLSHAPFEALWKFSGNGFIDRSPKSHILGHIRRSIGVPIIWFTNHGIRVLGISFLERFINISNDYSATLDADQ